MSSSALEIGIIVLLILANGFFAASEIAVVSARRGRLEQRAKDGGAGAAAAIDLIDNQGAFLSTVQVGITLIGTLAAAFGGARVADALAEALRTIPLLAPYAETLGLAIVVLMISYLSLIVGELVPKRLALQNAEGVASFVAPVMRVVGRVAAPVVWFLTISTEIVLRLLGRHNVEEAPITEDDVLALVREGAREGTVEASEQDLIRRVFALTERSVRSIMTPRTQMIALDITTPFDQVLRAAVDSGFSRIPVYEKVVDHVIGVLHVKDLLSYWGQNDRVVPRSLLRPPVFVFEGQRAVIALQSMKQQRAGLAIVLDEYGQVAGVVAIEDVVEELVGDIADEHDEALEAIQRRADGSYLIDGLLGFEDLRAHFDMPDAGELRDEHEFVTIAGFLLALFDRIPSEGDQIEWHGYRFEVIDMDGQRIDKVLVRPPGV